MMATYLSDLASQGRKVTTISRKAASIASRHRMDPLPMLAVAQAAVRLPPRPTPKPLI
jgi:hypothetical protein